ncbi:MAG: protein kinase [Candidatus Cloacimonetes bacterium]|nr:protein kinase [Candidatus Cloacimonadota bacterium]
MIIDSRYKVIERLGMGAWAIVYQVKDLRTDKIYALKVFQKLDSQSIYEKFSAEDMFLITQIEHPNLIKVLNFGNSDKHIYYLSEYYEGKTLSQFNFNSSSISDLYKIIVQTCYGLDELHRLNIVHKDLKPDNIMYSLEEGGIKVKILDFGFTKVDLQKNQQHVSGTLPYIAPEIYRGKKGVPGSDFYALGVTLYKVTTGTLPYTLEQLSDMITGSRSSLFPKFPREINPAIPPRLEKLILKLMEKNIEDRFPDARSIIGYINRIQTNQYPYSLKFSLVNSIQNSSYLLREDYTHDLLDYIPLVKTQNGKVVVLSGEEGLGKDNILTLFRYHLLTNEYFVFDYTCSTNLKDPFFALIKEYHSSLANNQKISKNLVNISAKLKKFLYESEELASTLKENRKDLARDFTFSKNFIEALSEERPLIFIIRAGHFLTQETIDFINHISKVIRLNKILIILSVDNPGSVSGLIHPIHIEVEPFDFQKTKSYIEQLLNTEIPSNFTKHMHQKTNGNPSYIRELLIDLINKKMLWKRNHFSFDIDWEKYPLPERIIHNIYNNLSHVSDSSYNALQILSVTHTPLSANLIKYLLNIKNKELFFLLKDCINNHILEKKGDYYYFTFQEARERLFSETDKKTKVAIAKKTLAYFELHPITEISICEGIIKNAKLAGDHDQIRKYTLHLAKLYSNSGNQEKSFELVSDIIAQNFSGDYELPQKDILNDLLLFQELSELTGRASSALKLFNSISKMPNIFEKYYIRGILNNACENYPEGVKDFEKAVKLAITGRQQIIVMINLAWTYLVLNKLDKSAEYLNKLDLLDMSHDLKVAYIDRKALYAARTGNRKEAIQLLEDFKQNLEPMETPGYFAKLGSFYNNLAIYYSQEKAFDEALYHFNMAKKVWERINYTRMLGMVYNNIGDLALRQGNTNDALTNFENALKICTSIEHLRCEVLTYLNFGEAYIKLGRYEEAENSLLRAKSKIAKCRDKSFYGAIIHNLAIVKVKIEGFKDYYQFIKENNPELLNNVITEVNPLVKTYINFLIDLGQYDLVSNILIKSTKLDYLSSQEEEFYYQALGLLDFNKREYNSALENLNTSFDYAERNRSYYAQSILYTKMIECHLALANTPKARELSDKAQKLTKLYNYSYWNLVLKILNAQIDLQDENINLRIVLRSLFSVLEKIQKEKLFHLEIKVYKLLTIIYWDLNARRQANKYYKLYVLAVRSAVQGLPRQYQTSYKKKTLVDMNSPLELIQEPIVKRQFFTFEPWQEQLYELLKLDEVERFKFFIGKMLNKLFAPQSYSLVLLDDYNKGHRPFLNHNFREKLLFTAKIDRLIRECIRNNEIFQEEIENNHLLFIPLRFKSIIVGCLIIGDLGELAFTRQELKAARELRLHLTSLLIRIRDISAINKSINQMKQLMTSTNEIFSLLDLEKIEHAIISFCIDFVQCSRAFLIKKDIYGNFVYQIAMDSYHNILQDHTYISKTVLSEVYNTRNSVYTINAMEDNTFKNSISVQDYQLHSIYCAPLVVADKIHGLLYLDNYGEPERELIINHDLMQIMLLQYSVALKNSQQYFSLMKSIQELKSLDIAKNEFMGLISHELNTPLMVLRSYMNKLKKEEAASPEEKKEVITKADEFLRKISDKINDIFSFTKYSILSSIPKVRINIRNMLQVIVDEAETIAKERNMIFSLEVKDDIPDIDANWEAIYLMIYQIVINAIRYTKDFGTIKIGARKSSFHNEEIDNKETLVIYVQDNGIGIPANELENIFIPFHELTDILTHHSGTIEYKSSGLGLGLSTAKRIAELHSGKINVKSKEGEGTTVFIMIPYSKIDGSVSHDKVK